jgi:urease accessory protein
MWPVTGDGADAQTVAIEPPDRTAGSGTVRVERVGPTSVATKAYASSPLRLLTPRNHGTAAWVFTSTYGGGLVDRDALRLEATVDRGATMLLATQAATKVYRSPSGTITAIEARVEDDGLLMALPDPVICFAGAKYRQHQAFDLAASAALVYVDWFTSGRHGSGERWEFERYASRLTVRRAGRPALLDALTLDGRDGSIGNRMGRFDVLLMAVIIGPVLERHAAGILARVSQMPLSPRAELLIGASAVAGGCILRIAGRSIEEVSRALRGHLDFVPAILGDNPWSRKW